MQQDVTFVRKKFIKKLSKDKIMEKIETIVIIQINK